MPFLVDSLQLKSFIAIAETGSFGKAARTVSRTQSALSLQIKKLEDQLGCQLFDRGGRKVTLTPEGEIFLGYARQMKQLQWEVFSRLREPDVEGEIRFGTPEDFATHYLPDVLARFRKHHPRVQLNVSCDLTLNLLEQFQQGQFDVILVKRDPQSVKGGTKVWREPLVWQPPKDTVQRNDYLWCCRHSPASIEPGRLPHSIARVEPGTSATPVQVSLEPSPPSARDSA